MHVLQLNSMLKGGGTDDQCLKLSQGLAALGVKVTIAGPSGRELSGHIGNVSAEHLDTAPEGPLKLRLMRKVASFLREEKVDILHAHHGRDYWPAVIARRLSGTSCKLVLTRHLAKSPGSWLGRRFLLGASDAFVAVSRFVEEVLTKGHSDPSSPEAERHHRPPMGGDFGRIKMVYGGIDTEAFHPSDASAQRAAWNLDPSDYAFAVVGGYDHPRGKGQREFLRAAAQITASAPRAKFLVVGRGTLGEQLKQDIVDLNLADRAFLTPYAPDMPTAMNALDCLVHPQIGTESFGLVLCEAFACGKPVIASALDGIPEAFHFGQYGQLVPPENVDALARAMIAQVGAKQIDPEPLHAKIAGSFSLQRMAENYLQLYEELLNR
jgi:glycosyltransferase involved in cell wall biosynthesis